MFGGATVVGLTSSGAYATPLDWTGTPGGALTITKMADAGTLELTTAAASTTVTMTDATGAVDSFNIVTKLTTAAVN